MKLQTIAAAAILAFAGAANASLSNFESGNSSVAFVSYDNVGAVQGSVFVDLGFSFNDFIPSSLPGGSVGNLSSENTSVVWNFGNNTITKNGVTQSSTNNFSAFAAYTAAAGADAKWGVMAGNTVTDVLGNTSYMATGKPTASQLTQQADSSPLQLVAPLYNNTNAAITGSDDNGSYFAPSAADGAWVANTAYGMGAGNWQNNTKWSTVTNLTQLNAYYLYADGTEAVMGATVTAGADTTGLLNGKGTFTLDKVAQTLTWKTATFAVTPSIPEPSSYALALVALAAIGVATRRKAK
ncbi:MAG: PEP-CTERM sorting domain-containing protein [Aquabacterium sp.]|nr:PEP-CTERM sorting domain-containing protein [Aquabacterium sp.]